MPDINPILKAAQEASSALGTGTAEIQKYTSEQADASMAIMEAIRGKARADALVSDTEQLFKLQNEQAIQKVGDIYQTDVSKSTEVLTGLARESQRAFQEKLAARKDIAEKQSTNFFDDPLGFIVNRFTINDDIARYNEASSRHAAYDQRQEELNALSQAGVQTQKAFLQTVTAASAKAKSDAIIQAAEVQAQQAIINAKTYGIEGVKAAMRLPLDQLQIQTNVFSAKAQQESHAIALKNLELAQSRFNWEKLKYDEKQGDEDSFNARLVGIYNKGLQIIQGPKAIMVEPDSKDGKFIAKMLSSNTEAGKEYQRVFFAGQSGVVAPNVTKTINAVDSGAGVYFTPEQQKVKELLGKVKEITIKDPTLDKKDPNAISAFQSSVVKKLVLEELGDIKIGTDSLFDPPSMNSIIKLDPQLQKLPVVQKVLAPLITSGAELTPARAFPAIAEALSKKEISMPEAVAASSIFQRQILTKVASLDLTKFGIAVGKDEALTAFKTRIPVNPGGLFGGNETVAIADPMELTRALMTYASKKQFLDNYSILETGKGRAIDRFFFGDASEPATNPPNIYNASPEYWNRVRGGK